MTGGLFGGQVTSYPARRFKISSFHAAVSASHTLHGTRA